MRENAVVEGHGASSPREVAPYKGNNLVPEEINMEALATDIVEEEVVKDTYKIVTTMGFVVMNGINMEMEWGHTYDRDFNLASDLDNIMYTKDHNNF